ncbi:MAG: electron transport complex subunit RsxC [Muribaculaceae bacterium]
MLKTFKIGGIHVPENKLTAGAKIIDIPTPREIVVTFSQHIGAMAKCIVNVGDKVKKYDIIAEASSMVSANIHTSISGTVKKIDKWKTAFGYPADTVTIVADDDDVIADNSTTLTRKSDIEVSALTHDELVSIIDKSGIVGLGGATFPTKVKLMPPPGMKAEILIINGVECEPYLTNDDAIMLEYSAEIVEGVRLLMRASQVKKAVIAIENNKLDAIASLMQILEDDPHITVLPLKVKYPQGSEKQLIETVLRKEVPTGKLPIATGAIVQNVATAYAVYRAVRYGEPLVSRVITITGESLKAPGNYRVMLGTQLSDVIEIAGGIPEDTGKIILGGPMMGKAIVSVKAPMIKGISGILFVPKENAQRRKEEPCIRCGACVNACPMGLEPYLLMTLSVIDEIEQAEKEKIRNCIECGCCTYSCPASRPILDYIKLGKIRANALVKERNSKK